MPNPKICPVCGGNSKIIDSRVLENKIRRRKECIKCGVRFTTYEITDIEFSNFRGLELAIEKFNRR